MNNSCKDKVSASDKKQSLSVRWVLSSLALSMLLSSLGVSIANIALPTLTDVFSASFQAVQWIVIVYLLAITVMVVSVGRLGDIMGHRRVLLFGISLFTAASILCGVAPTLWVLIGARVLQGVGAAILMALTVALVRNTVPNEKTGSAMGLLGTMSAIGTALGPSLGGVLISGFGWRSIFLIMVPLGIFTFVLAYRYLPDQEKKEKPDRNGFDSLGTLLLGLTLAAYALAVTVGDGHFGQLNAALMMAAALGVGLFLFVEKKVKSPLIQPAVFRDGVISSSLAMNALVASVMMATLVVGPFYLSRALGIEPVLVGLVMSIGPIISIFSGVPAGRIVDRLGAPFMVTVGLIAMTAGAFALSVFPGMFGVAGYILAIMILTPGYQLFQASNNTQVMMDVAENQRGVISGALSLSRNLGLITGASVMGAVFAFASGSSDITTATANAAAFGMEITFAAAGGLMVVSLIIAVISLAAMKERTGRLAQNRS
ncbi:MAG: MFS transporter [Acidiferrobacterales bacterium]|nr:MFS transporter [Acidiferrobacterales bacterium]